jgi:hypothetical protein
LKKLQEIQDKFKFDGIWHDSFTGALSIDYSAEIIKSHMDQQMQYLSATQEMGYSPYLESLGSIGMTGVGSYFVTPLDSLGGDRDLYAAFGGREYLAYKTAFTLSKVDDHPMQIDYYKFLANKAVPTVDYYQLNDGEKDIVSQSNKDYNDASPYMDKRHVLPNEKGVLWEDKESNTQVLFAYREFSYNLEGGINEVFDFTSNSNIEIIDGTFTTEPKHTYKLQ